MKYNRGRNITYIYSPYLKVRGGGRLKKGSFKTHWNQIYRCERKLKLKLEHRRCDQGVYRIARGQHPQHQIPTKFSQNFSSWSFRRCLKKTVGIYVRELIMWASVGWFCTLFAPIWRFLSQRKHRASWQPGRGVWRASEEKGEKRSS